MKGFKVKATETKEQLREFKTEDGYVAHFHNGEKNSLRVIIGDYIVGYANNIEAALKLIEDHKILIMRAKAKLRGKTIVFCLPGRSVSYTFLKNFVQLSFDLAVNNTGCAIQQEYSSMVNFARCKCLGYNVTRGKYQIPWNGQLNYDYQMWIDSDIVFNSNVFWKLVDTCIFDNEKEDTRNLEEWPLMNKTDEELETIGYWEESVRKEKIQRLMLTCNPITSGYYATEDRMTVPVAHWIYDGEEFIRNGGMMRSESLESMAARKKPFTCDYVGFGFVLVARGVFENMIYPVFGPKLQAYDNGIEDFCGEDVGFCLDAKALGLSIVVDPAVRVGHEKMVTL